MKNWIYDQKGAIPLLILVAVIGLVVFVALASFSPFNNRTLQTLYPKSESLAASLDQTCADAVVIPVGAIAGQPKPLWCYLDLLPNSGIPDTHIDGTNSWVDDFNHGVSFGEFLDGQGGYRIFQGPNTPANGPTCKSIHWRHSNHWMVDFHRSSNPEHPEWSTGIGCEKSFMRPNKAFKFEKLKNADGSFKDVNFDGTVNDFDKVLVVEFDVAAGIQNYNDMGDVWPDVVITGAPQPTGNIRDRAYGYGQFGGFNTIGCRMQMGSAICSFLRGVGRPLDESQCNVQGDSGREWEISSHQKCGTEHWGDGRFASHSDTDKPEFKLDAVWPPTGVSLDKAFRICGAVDPDTNCRDRFRWEIYRDGMILYANGVKYFVERGMNSSKVVPDDLFNGDVYVYFIESASAFDQSIATRFHWDRLAINPKNATGAAIPPSSAPDYDPRTAVATPTPTPISTPTPTPAPAGNYAITFDDKVGQNQNLIGHYPNGLIDWGTNNWYHSAPWKLFTTKSISFRTAQMVQASFNFLTPRRLVSLKAYNGGTVASRITISCVGQLTKDVVVDPNVLVDIPTGWGGTCSQVTIGSTNGDDTNFDDFVVDSGGGPAPTTSPTSKPGDLNNDNTINALDFAVLLSKWGSSDPVADLNGDGSVGLVDFSILLSKWGS